MTHLDQVRAPHRQRRAWLSFNNKRARDCANATDFQCGMVVDTDAR